MFGVNVLVASLAVSPSLMPSPNIDVDGSTSLTGFGASLIPETLLVTLSMSNATVSGREIEARCFA